MVNEAYTAYIWHKRIVVMAMAAIAIIAAVLSLTVGSASLSIPDVVSALLGRAETRVETIVWNVRMPRIAAAIAVGAALSLSGCMMQCTLQNPLASSSTLGVSQGASFGAALAIILLGSGTLDASEPYIVTLVAFICGMATTIAILMFSRLRSSTPSAIVLSGVAISSLFSGATTLIQYFADDEMVSSIVYWTFGNLGRATWNEIAIISTLAVFALVFLIANRWNYNAIGSGSNTAKSLGVNVELLVPATLALSALITSSSVAFTGCINFIGLIAPHAARRFVGNDYRFLIPASALTGSVLLLITDIACRTVIEPIVLPVGALTSFMGAPLFLYLILKERGRR